MGNARRLLTITLAAAASTAEMLVAPAGAAQPEVQKHSCQSGGGAYAISLGYKSCTTVSTTPEGREAAVTHVLASAHGTTVDLTLFFRVDQERSTTTVRTERGQELTVTTAEQTSAPVVQLLKCEREFFYDPSQNFRFPGGVVPPNGQELLPLSACDEFLHELPQG